MFNRLSWTCNYLQEKVQDFDGQTLYTNERIMCRQAQLQAELGGCSCGGAILPLMNPQFTDVHSSCNLFVGKSSSMVPIIITTRSFKPMLSGV